MVELDILRGDGRFYVRLREDSSPLSIIGPFDTYDEALWVLEDYVDEGVGTNAMRSRGGAAESQDASPLASRD